MRFALFILLFSTSAFALECKPYSTEFNTQLKNVRNLVFFASWCQSCVESIKGADLSKDVFIAVFDEKKKAESALSFVLKEKSQKAICFFDKDSELAKLHDVTNLPAAVKLGS